jgi:hypothetical protein
MVAQTVLDIGFDPAAHRYTLDGQPAVSVTQVLQAEGLTGNRWWTEASRDRGTKVHRIALLLSHGAGGSTPEEIIANSRWNPETTHPTLVPYGLGCVNFYHKTGLKPVLVEERVASRKFQICGTFDLLAELPNGATLLVDFKTGEPEDAAACQVQLYAMCLEETYGLKPDLVTIVELKSDGKFKMWPPKPPGGEDLAIGCQAINLYNWRKAHQKLG